MAPAALPHISPAGPTSRRPAAPVAQLPTVDILVAKSDIGLGQSVKPEDLQWQTWPAAAASNSFIRRNERPDATTQSRRLDRARAFHRGRADPRAETGEGRRLAASWRRSCPTGMRAISTEISPETGAGGFILPNDRVDVLLSKREKNPDSSVPDDVVNSEIILANVRVLAIDQAPKEKDGTEIRWSARPRRSS